MERRSHQIFHHLLGEMVGAPELCSLEASCLRERTACRPSLMRPRISLGAHFQNGLGKSPGTPWVTAFIRSSDFTCAFSGLDCPVGIFVEPPWLRGMASGSVDIEAADYFTRLA
jgi:hypothetical protein